MDKFLNFYSKYPWVSVIIIVQWIATAFILIYGADRVDVAKVMGIAFASTVIFSYFGFKIPKN
jgi:hypothetical protein